MIHFVNSKIGHRLKPSDKHLVDRTDETNETDDYVA